jgi:hypothetical protein
MIVPSSWAPRFGRRRLLRLDSLPVGARTVEDGSARREVSCPSFAQLSRDLAPRRVQCLDVVSFLGEDKRQAVSQPDLDFR